MSQNYRVLAINPGSTSTKIGVFEGEKLVYEGVVRHTAEEIAAWGGVIAQAPNAHEAYQRSACKREY